MNNRRVSFVEKFVLPKDVWLFIFRKLELKDVLAVRSTCKDWRHIVDVDRRIITSVIKDLPISHLMFEDQCHEPLMIHHKFLTGYWFKSHRRLEWPTQFLFYYIILRFFITKKVIRVEDICDEKLRIYNFKRKKAIGVVDYIKGCGYQCGLWNGYIYINDRGAVKKCNHNTLEYALRIMQKRLKRGPRLFVNCVFDGKRTKWEN